MSEPVAEPWRPIIRSRLVVALAFFGAWAGVVEARLLYLQVYRNEHYVERSDRQRQRTVPVQAKRGEILDRYGRVLAYSVEVESLYAVPGEVGDPVKAVQAICRALRSCSAEFRASVVERLRKPRQFAWVKRHVTAEEARRVRELDLPGFSFLKETRRFYPNTTIAAHVIGAVDIDNRGLGGIERAYDKDIAGRPGTAVVQNDARRRVFSRTEKPSVSGSTVTLTIDQVLQWIVERELSAGVLEHRAQGGTAIVMDPWTGEVLAMASVPTFDPNAFPKALDSEKVNRAIQNIYEPGSTFKIVTASAALEEGIVKPTDVFNVSPGYIRIGTRTVRDVHRYSDLTFEDVMVKSSNVGAIKVGFKLGGERLNRYVRRFGFGQTLLPDLRGEEPGIVWSQLSDTALASVSMGYQVSVTPLQMVTAVSSIANGGKLMEPRLLRWIEKPHGRAVVKSRALRQTIAPSTVAELTRIMEAVVERGTAKAARIEGYTIAGKTGTAAKLTNGMYSKSQYMSSFVGFLPSRKPAVSILVVIDSPSRGAYYGGAVAAPVFKRIAEATLRHLGLPPTVDTAPPVLVKRASHETTPVSTASVRPAIVPAPPAAAGVLPDLRGLSAREATQWLARAGLRSRLVGSGFVVEQQPQPGTPLDDASVCRLVLDRAVRGPEPDTNP